MALGHLLLRSCLSVPTHLVWLGKEGTMNNVTRFLGFGFLILNLAVAGLWLTVLHPGTGATVGNAASGQNRPSGLSPVVTVPSSSAYFVGNIVPVFRTGCAPKPTGMSVRSPIGAPVAQFDQAPAGFSQSVGALFPPCSTAGFDQARIQALVKSADPGSLATVGIVEYTGTSGSLTVTTLRPDAAALSRGLFLGNPAGSLSDGTPFFTLEGSGDGHPVAMVRWFKDGVITDVASTNATLAQLDAFANHVALK